MPTFAGNLDALEPTRAYVTDVAEGAGLGSTAAFDLALAVDEIATNIVLHGYEEAGASGDITVDASVADGALTVAVTDSSAGYEPDRVPFDETVLRKPLAERAPGGLGLFLARQGVDELRYVRGDGCNVHELVVRLGENR